MGSKSGGAGAHSCRRITRWSRRGRAASSLKISPNMLVLGASRRISWLHRTLHVPLLSTYLVSLELHVRIDVPSRETGRRQPCEPRKDVALSTEAEAPRTGLGARERKGGDALDFMRGINSVSKARSTPFFLHECQRSPKYMPPQARERFQGPDRQGGPGFNGESTAQRFG